MDVKSRRVTSTHFWMGKRSRISEIFSSGDVGLCVGSHPVGSCCFSDRGIDTRGCLPFRLPSSRLGGCCGFRLRLLRPGRLPGGGHFRLPEHLRDRLKNGFWIGVWVGVVVSW